MHTLLTLPMGCAIFSLKLIPQTVEAEITAVMPSQRACDAENQARYTLSNGPLRVQRNAFCAQSILQRVGIRQLPGDMMVSPPSARVTVNSRWHRGSFVSLVSHSSLTDCTVLSGALLFAKKLLWQNAKGAFLFQEVTHAYPTTARNRQRHRRDAAVRRAPAELRNSFRLHHPHRSDAHPQERVHPLLHARIRAGGRPLGPLHVFGLRPKARDHVH